jgi:hypothetical protein
MNSMDSILPQQREAKLRYLDHEFEVIKPGDYVRCGITGDPVRLENLRYWNIEKQIPYRSAAESFADYLRAQKT